MELDFTDRKVIYGLTGVQKGKKLRSLFWTQPYIIAPSKNAEHWVQTKMKFDAILSVLKTHIDLAAKKGYTPTRKGILKCFHLAAVLPFQ